MMPTNASAAITREVATGRRMNGSEGSRAASDAAAAAGR